MRTVAVTLLPDSGQSTFILAKSVNAVDRSPTIKNAQSIITNFLLLFLKQKYRTPTAAASAAQAKISDGILSILSSIIIPAVYADKQSKTLRFKQFTFETIKRLKFFQKTVFTI